MDPAQQQLIMTLMEKNPELFERIAKEIKELTDKGKPEMYASFEVMNKYKKELQELMAGEDMSQLQNVANQMMGGNK
ncbi:MAG: hypothetical protein ORN26_01465 [Candidatus Pacebacteria bacterium]|nr:hypothetical protein [Candidatus Paceibacterota bacterium]